MSNLRSSQGSIDSGFSALSHAGVKSSLTGYEDSQAVDPLQDEESQINRSSGPACMEFSFGNNAGYSMSPSRVNLDLDDRSTTEFSDRTSTSSDHTSSYPRIDAQHKDPFHSSFLELRRPGKFDEKTLCSRDENLKENFDAYKALYSIKFGSFTSIDLTTWLHNLKPTKFKKLRRNPITTTETHLVGCPVAKVLFFVGFLFFPAWIYGSLYLPSQIKTTGDDYIWRGRNRTIFLIFTVFSMISVLAFIITEPRYFGLTGFP